MIKGRLLFLTLLTLTLTLPDGKVDGKNVQNPHSQLSTLNPQLP
jgi:hypothetical protein